MYLSRLELQGFKSFAKRTILEFPKLSDGEPGITSILGPNGSGKSNIADAVRWVLGEQSLKLLRAKKSEDIIFSGSEKKGRLNLAEVSLYLNNEDKKVDIEYSELCLTRRLYRDGISEYVINGNTVRREDVIFLLAKAQFGQKSYSVIGQGMIDHVLAASPQERKDFFYEATGVREYQLKREQSLHKLERTREHLQTVELTLREMEPHLRSLERMAKRLEQRHELEQELRTLQKLYYEEKWYELQKQFQSCSDRVSRLQEDQEGKQKNLLNLQQELHELECAESHTFEFETLEREHQRFLNEKARISRDLASLKGKLDLAYEQAGKLNLVWLSKRKDDLEQKQKELQAEQTILKQQISGEDTSMNALEENRLSLEGDIKTVQKEIKVLQEKFNNSQVFSWDQLQNDVEVIFRAQERFLVDLDAARDPSDFSSLRESAAAIFERLRTLHAKAKQSERETGSGQIFALQEGLSALLQQKGELLAEISTLQAHRRALEQQTEERETELNKLSAETESLSLELAVIQKPEQQDQYQQALKQQCAEYEARLNEIEEALLPLRMKMKDFYREEEEKRQKMISLQNRIEEKQRALSRTLETLNAVKIECARLEVHREELEREIAFAFGDLSLLSEFTRIDVWDRKQAEELYPQIQRLKHRLELIGGMDEEALKEYSEVKDRHAFLSTEYEDLTAAMASLQKIVRELTARIDEQFQESFERINSAFGNYFQLLFGGGKASLTQVMEDAEEIAQIGAENLGNTAPPENTEDAEKTASADERGQQEQIFAGIEISACPPGKKVRHITALSGGERALTSIALLSAIISENPSPFVVLDEVDAALDETNSDKFAEIVETLSHKTQFIVITHNRATMRRSHILYGVTAGSGGVSQLISMKLSEAERLAKR